MTSPISKPMLFSSDMVRALMRDVDPKTQSRRVMKDQPSDDWHPHSWGEVHKIRDGEFVMRNGSPVVIGWGPSNDLGDEAYICPHPGGSVIWVKETFGKQDDKIVYRADMDGLEDEAYRQFFDWKPSIFMPRWASRITLEVTAVKVERLNDISEEDVKAEGCTWDDNLLPPRASGVSPSKRAYFWLWESINGKGSWAMNPWVWCYTFRRVKP